MSSRVFMGVIVQMKEATDRCVGVADEQGFVIASSELSMIGSHLDDLQSVPMDATEQIFTTGVEPINCWERPDFATIMRCSFPGTTRWPGASVYWLPSQ